MKVNGSKVEFVRGVSVEKNKREGLDRRRILTQSMR